MKALAIFGSFQVAAAGFAGAFVFTVFRFSSNVFSSLTGGAFTNCGAATAAKRAWTGDPADRGDVQNPVTCRTRMLVSAWYGHVNGKALEITSNVALWYRPGTPVLPVRWVLVRDPDDKRNPQAFFSTDINLEPSEIIALSVRRWQIEVTFAETRAHPGVETQRQWTDNAIIRTHSGAPGILQPHITNGHAIHSTAAAPLTPPPAIEKAA